MNNISNAQHRLPYLRCHEAIFGRLGSQEGQHPRRRLVLIQSHSEDFRALSYMSAQLNTR
ncbi:hypothetical protein FOMPIDRAFT_1025083 [Fomitopsis schrenkii]|uniref:Uncharacterized protein n=1 Tax=Fomitopsis schrenkii TaxID=2126942 RepID=S8DXC9_FOMSC|nr:hypothetical protein FOMPIDRAFT_1025083 [Fomitopsis schrenkii]